jgi:hypothetical protein
LLTLNQKPRAAPPGLWQVRKRIGAFDELAQPGFDGGSGEQFAENFNLLPQFGVWNRF